MKEGTYHIIGTFLNHFIINRQCISYVDRFARLGTASKRYSIGDASPFSIFSVIHSCNGGISHCVYDVCAMYDICAMLCTIFVLCYAVFCLVLCKLVSAHYLLNIKF